MSQDPQHKPKTTIIPAEPGLRGANGLPIVAWVIEDARIVRAVCFDPSREIEAVTQREPAGSSHE